MKAIYCGTPEIAVPALRALADVAEIVGVVSQPDRPAGRGMKLRAPAVKEAALELGVEVFQPEKVKDGTLRDWMKKKDADVALVMAYGRILPVDVLLAPRLGCVNLHASLLPAYRGAAPIQHALMDGQPETGVCLMKMDEGMDTGDVLAVRRTPITESDDAGTLAQKLAELAAALTREELPRFVLGELTAVGQNHERATYARPISNDDQELDLNVPAERVHNRIRALTPYPGARTTLRREGQSERRLKVLATRRAENSALPEPPPAGLVVVAGGRPWVGTATEPLEILLGQVEGKKAQSGQDLVNGRVLRSGDRLG